MFCACSFHGISMNNLLPYCGLANVRIIASDKDLPVRYNQPSRIFLPKKKYILNPLNRGPQEFEFCIFDAFSCDHTSSAGQHGCLVKRSKFMFPMQLERHVRIHPWVMMVFFSFFFFAQYDPALVDLFPFAYDQINMPTVEKQWEAGSNTWSDFLICLSNFNDFYIREI